MKALLLNAFRTLGLAAGDSARAARKRLKRLRREAAANIAEAEDAVSRLQSRDEWLVETIANGDPVEAPWHDFVARFRSLSLEARDAGTWIAAHQEAAKTTADPAFRRAMRIFLKRLAGPIRAGDLARCLDGFPARLLEVNSVLGAAALEQGRESEAREHLKAIAGSPAGAVARRLAIRRLVANRALAVTEVLRPAETALQSLEGHESPDPGEAKSAAASVTQAISSARPMIHWLENLGPEAAEGSRDVAAALARRAALLVGRAGGDPVPGLREASGLAGEAELRADIEADLADPSWAVAIAQALYPLRHGGVEHAWRRVRRLRRKADTAARRERLRSLLARPSSFLNPARGRPWSFTAYGSGPGYFGKRPDPADLRLYVASHAWRIFRMPVFTLGAYLFASSDPAAKRPEPKRDHFLGQVPLAFRPSRAKLFAKGGAVMALLLVIAFAGLDFVSNISGYQRLRTICAQGEDADLKSRCSALQDLSDRGSFYVRWKSRRKLAEILLPRVRAIRTYADLYGFVRELGGPEEEWDRGMKFYVRWFPPEMDAAVEECLQRLPPPALPPTGGAWWSVDRIPFEERAVPLGQFVEWACDSSPGIYPRRATFALDAARRLDAPHLWVLAVKYSREYDQIQSAEAVAALTRWLKSAQYWEWFQHIYALPDSRGDVRERVAVEALRTHALGLCDDYTGFGSYLKFLPPDYRRLLETDSNLVAEERLALLDVLPETPALGEPERTWYISGLMRRKGFDLIRTGSDHSDYAAIRRGIDLLLNVLESSPDDHVAAAQAVDQLVVLGETEQALQLGRRFPCDEVLPPMGLALFNAGRVEETIATLEPHVARHFDDFHTMHSDYKRALREAKAAWEKKLKGEMPSEFDQKRIVEYDHGSFLATADEWLDRLARVDSLPRKLRIRMWRAQDWRGAARLLARALAASGIAKGPEAAERVARALELQRRVCEVSPYVDEDAGVLTICEMLSAGSGIDAIRQRLELDNRGEALLQLGELLKASGNKAAAFSAYASAWERLPETDRVSPASECFGLAPDAATRLVWGPRCGIPEEWCDATGFATQLSLQILSGDYDVAGPRAKKAAEGGEKFVTNPGVRLGVASMWSLAHLCSGNEDELEAAARHARLMAPDPPAGALGLQAVSKILASRAFVALSKGSVREDVLHETPDASWIWFSRFPESREDLASAARANEDLTLAIAKADTLLKLKPHDLTGLWVKLSGELARGDAEALARLRQTADDAPGEGDAPVVFSGPGCGLSPDELVATVLNSLVPRYDQAVEEAQALGDKPTWARALQRRALIRLMLAADSAEEFDRAVYEAQLAVNAFPCSQTRSILMTTLLARAGRARTATDPALAAAAKAEGPASLPSLLGLRAELSTAAAEFARTNDDVRRAATIAVEALDDPSSWTGLETALALRLAGHERFAEAAKRLASEGLTIEMARFACALSRRSAQPFAAAWLAATYSGKPEVAEFLARRARESGVSKDLLSGDE